jgi:hypothetical protein
MSEYELWIEAGKPMSVEFREWLTAFDPDWQYEYSGDVWGMMKAFEAGRTEQQRAQKKS